MGTRPDKHPGICKIMHDTAKSIPDSVQCHKDDHCTRPDKHPGICKIMHDTAKSIPDSVQCHKDDHCTRPDKHPGLCKVQYKDKSLGTIMSKQASNAAECLRGEACCKPSTNLEGDEGRSDASNRPAPEAAANKEKRCKTKDENFLLQGAN